MQEKLRGAWERLETCKGEGVEGMEAKERGICVLRLRELVFPCRGVGEVRNM